MCDDPRNPHRLRFDPKRKDKVEVSENDRPVPGKQRLRVQHPGRCSSTNNEERVLSPPTGHSGNILTCFYIQ